MLMCDESHRPLSFANEGGNLIGRETGSQWNPASGKAIAGPLAGQILPRAIGVVADRRAWGRFHPDSEYCRAGVH